MDNQALKKYSPLGLLALAIVAGVVAVSTHTPPNEDAGYDVIGYFYCENKDYNFEPAAFVLVNEGSAFKILGYDFFPRDIEKGKPTDLSFFVTVKTESEEVSTESYSWTALTKSGEQRLDVLNRANGKLTQTVKSKNAVGMSVLWDCKFGEEGKELVWETVVDLYSRKSPKF